MKVMQELRDRRKIIMKANIGLIGVGVMGENLIMNMESRGYTVSCYDVLLEKTKDFAEGRANGKKIIPTYSLEEFVNSLERPRKIMIRIKAGAPVDSVIESLISLLDKLFGKGAFAESIRYLQELVKNS